MSAPTGLSSNRITIAVVVAVACSNVLLVVWSVQTKSKRVPQSTPVAPGAGGVLLHEPEGKRFVGDQLQFFNVSADGEISSTNVAWISLYYTEGKPFRLSGQVWLSELKGAPVSDLPDGFALFLREWDGMHRYQLNTRTVDVKRRLQGGQREKGIAQAASFDAPEFGTWLSFSADVSVTNLTFSIGGTSQQAVEIPGPLDIDGANKIAIAPGARLKNLRLDVGPR